MIMMTVTKLWTQRELMWYWTQREIRVRYKQSLLGIVWAILQPAALALVFTFVFSYIAQVPSDGVPYPIFAYAALLPWTFLATAVAMGVPSLVNHMGLITKSNFPREILPLSIVWAALLDFLFAFLIFIVMLLLFRMPLSIHVIWFPLLLILQVALTIGVILLGATLNVFFRDIRFIVPLLLQIWLYATPVIYPVSMVPQWLLPYYALNPMVGIIESYRAIFLHAASPAWNLLAIGTVVTLVVLCMGFVFFKRTEPLFADII